MNPISNIIKDSLNVVSPSWPLYSFVGVNPFWNLKDKPFYLTLSELSCINGENLFLPIHYFFEKYKNGVITYNDIKKSIELLNHFNIKYTQDIQSFLRESLEEQEHLLSFNTYSEFLGNLENINVKEIIVDEITKYCSSYFDLGQAAFSLKNTKKRLYSEWKGLIIYDNTLSFLGYKNNFLNGENLPENPEEMINKCRIILNINNENNFKNYLMKVCKHIMGWCSHIQYQIWQNDLELNKNYKGTKLEDIIAIFMAYECVIKNSKKEWDEAWTKFLTHQESIFSKNEVDHIFKLLCIWQRAFELSYQRKLSHKIISDGFHLSDKNTKDIQMIFCIDVRSETIRRKIEETIPEVSTHGFAGFFGVSLECNQVTNEISTYRCPVLIQPKIAVNEILEENQEKKVLGLKSLNKFTTGLKQGLASSFAYVELFGILSGYKILSKSISHNKKSNQLFKNKFFKTSILNHNLNLEKKLEIAEFVLTHFGINEYSKIVIICGHGSLTTNNAFASSLNCGACGGYSGDLNARFICQILNDKDVRIKILEKNKFKLSNETIFLPAFHETVSDEIHILDEEFSLKDYPNFLNFKKGLQKASHLAQKDRSLYFKNYSLSASERSSNWSEVRPEWALVNNACFIIAPRERSKNLNLEGRAFLHDYHFEQDEGMKTLELIMTAPMIVTNWINMQYYASSVERNTFGSGDKTIHNIVGLFRVLEGNSGDLKIGLPFQSIHDGTHLIHEPLRLSVFIEAPQIEIEKIIDKHKNLSDLIDNQWLHLFSIDKDTKKVLYRISKNKFENLLN
ncbi:putative inorganic carbon transporter subunit DabA [Silvanigrella sp.]|jgi:uncharacterized protein YbcC (UPF0753/DUF2309 family)|uniref:putative inorganic carbon transporter subunit DabA n=1 Tax=Silvanigrella sp. TaxID=2024976 RepID=UPI0037C6FE53